MIRTARLLLVVALLCSFCLAQRTEGASPAAPQTVSARVGQLKKHDGFVPYYWDERRGEILFEIAPDFLYREFLYFTALGSGVGSTEMFADRSSFGASAQIRFSRIGLLLYAAGSDPVAAFRSGVDVRVARTLAYTFGGVACVGTVFFAHLDQHGFTGAFRHATPFVIALFTAAALLSITLPRTALSEEELVEID